MNLNRHYDEAAAAVSTIYGTYLDGLGSTFEHLASGIDSPLRLSQLSAVHLQSRNTQTVAAIMSVVSAVFRAAVADAATAAAGGNNVRLQEDLRAYLAGALEAFQDMLTRAASRDQAGVSQTLRQIALRRHLGGSGKRIKPAFLQVDAAGRRRDSIDYLSLAARGLIVRAVVETFVFVGYEAGHREFVAIYPNDPEHRHNGARFGVAGARRVVMSFNEALADIFHPNTGAVPALKEA
ncbi:hypothetical protein [Cupriavidus metallidurans]|uniref:hypothetical protein n=1 Tax=Cupriavidus metallidurans TaxID=119219 RepID=UPI001CCABB47|nr:hypothetical protein [Cupriavidus metallidurans]UBM12762.1 hypothetical protein LAI70_27810 [Cupriavidus metallidurans]